MTNEKKYLVLMAKYKELRVKDGPKANKYLEAAMKVREGGDVKDDIVFGSAIL